MDDVQAKLEDSNVANIGSDEDKAARKGAAQTEDAWKGAGKKPGVEVWRIEKFTVQHWPEEEYGNFFAGDSYIVLYTYQKRNPETGKLTDKLLHNVHFWLGGETTQDEAGTAAYKTVELDDLLDGLPVQYREVMGCETAKFHKLFKKIHIMAGGIESGFKHVEAASYTARLLHVKGKESIRMMQVPLKLDSLNEGDVFILDSGLELWQWNGKNSSHHERKAANETIATIKTQRGSKPSSTILDHLEDDEKFWNYFGGKPEKFNPASSDEGVERATKLLQVRRKAKTTTFKCLATGAVEQKHLTSKGVFILDVGYQIYVWIGKFAAHSEKKEAMATATDYLAQNNYSVATPIVRVVEGMVCPEFDHEFSILGYSTGGVDDVESKEEKSTKKKKISGPPLGCVVVTVHEAKELYDSQLIGKQDPYCRVMLSKQKQQTETNNDGASEAKWNHTPFKFAVMSADDNMVLEVGNENIIKNARIGDVAIPVSTLLAHTTATTAWYPLTRKGEQPAGQIRVTTCFHKPMAITANEAKGIRSVQLLGKQDPYVRFLAGKTRFNTMYHNNGGKAPRWCSQNVFTFNAMMEPEDAMLTLWLRDKNVIVDKTIGYTTIPISRLLSVQKGNPVWFPLQRAAKDVKPCGELCLTIS